MWAIELMRGRYIQHGLSFFSSSIANYTNRTSTALDSQILRILSETQRKNMLDEQKIISTIHRHQSELKQKYPLKSIALFGSYVCGEQRADSDIDLLVDFTQPVGMEVVDLALDLEEILRQRVDIITYNAVKNRLFHHIEGDLMHI